MLSKTNTGRIADFILKSCFSMSSSKKDPWDIGVNTQSKPMTSQQANKLMHSLFVNCHSNLLFVNNTLALLFSTTTILGQNPLRSLRRQNKTFIKETQNLLVARRCRPALLPYADFTTSLMKPLMLLGNSQMYIAGRCLKSVQSQIDQFLRKLNDHDLEQPQFRIHLRKIRDTYNQYSEQMVMHPHCRVLEFNLDNLLKDTLQKLAKS